MEPDDILDGPAGGADELRAIVARAGRHRRRSMSTVAGVAAAVALAAGGGIGYAVSNHGSKANTVVAGSSNQAAGSIAGGAPEPVAGGTGGTEGGGAGHAGVAVPAVVQPITLTRLFTRTVGAVTVRGFTTPAPTASTSCMRIGPSFQAEISTPHMVGVADGSWAQATASGTAVVSVLAERLGVAEGAPVDAVIVHTASGATDVKASFAGASGATDEMAPVDGWAVLVDGQPSAPSSGQVATLTVTGSGGKVLQTVTADFGSKGIMPMYGGAAPAVTMPPSCYCGPVKEGATPSGSASTGSGSTSFRTIFSGTASTSRTPSSGAVATAPCVLPAPAPAPAPAPGSGSGPQGPPATVSSTGAG